MNVKMVGEVSTATVRVLFKHSLRDSSLICINLVCQTDDACTGFPLVGGIESSFDDPASVNMTCYKGGQTVFNNHQMCDVTSTFFLNVKYHLSDPRMHKDRKIIDMLPDRPPQVTFSCDSSDNTCAFQFWTAQVESFYCALDQCITSSSTEYNGNITSYDCKKIKCSCVPGRFICGEDGSVGAY